MQQHYVKARARYVMIRHRGRMRCVACASRTLSSRLLKVSLSLPPDIPPNIPPSRSLSISLLYANIYLHADKYSNIFVDGILMLIDLAGSERAADAREHSAERIAETKGLLLSFLFFPLLFFFLLLLLLLSNTNRSSAEINTSLMVLKDCIRARATASAQQEKFVHVPYRSSKLTVLLKDAFGILLLPTPPSCLLYFSFLFFSLLFVLFILLLFFFF